MSVQPYPTRGLITTGDLSTDADCFPPLSALPGQDFTISKGPEFLTGIKTSVSGRETTTAKWASPRWNFSLQWNVLRDQMRTTASSAAMLEVAKLLGSFASRLGRFGFFYYYDPDDAAVSGQSIGPGDGVSTSFQLLRTIGAGTPWTFVEPVYAVWTAPTVQVAGATKTLGSDYVVNPWGVVTFTTAPANGASITWSGTPLYMCRFDTDKLLVAQIAKGFWSQAGLPFVSRRP